MPLRLQALKNSRVFAGRRTNRAAPRTKNGPDTNHNEAGSGTKFTSGKTASVGNDPSRFTVTSAAMPFGSAVRAAVNSPCVCVQRKRRWKSWTATGRVHSGTAECHVEKDRVPKVKGSKSSLSAFVLPIVIVDAPGRHSQRNLLQSNICGPVCSCEVKNLYGSCVGCSRSGLNWESMEPEMLLAPCFRQ